MKTIAIAVLALAIAAASSSSSQAGDNRCVGVITAVAPWHPTLRIIDDQDEEVCRFDPLSKVGKRILSKCPVGTACEIALPLPPNGDVSTLPKVQVIKKVEWIERWPQ